MENNRKHIIILFLFIIVGVIYTFLTTYTGFYIPCLFNLITGLYCPGCGSTRMLKELLNLNFKKSFFYNPLVFCLIPFIFLYLLNEIRELRGKEKLFPLKVRNKFWNVILVIAIIFGILRNIPYFSVLRP